MRFWLDLAAVEALGRHGRSVRLAAAAPNQPDLSGSAFGLEAEPRVSVQMGSNYAQPVNYLTDS